MAISKSEQLMVADIMCIIRGCIDCSRQRAHDGLDRCKTDCYHIVVAQIEEIASRPSLLAMKESTLTRERGNKMKKAPKKYQKVIEKFMKSRGYKIIINRYPLSLCYDHEDESYKVVECNVTKEHIEDNGMFKQRALDIINTNDDLFLEIEKDEDEPVKFNVDFITLRLLPNDRAIVQIARNMLGTKGCPLPF